MHRSKIGTVFYGGEQLHNSQTARAYVRDSHRLNRVLSNIFAERLLLSLRRVDDPGTREVITSIAFNFPTKDAQGSMDSDLHEEKSSTHEGGSRSYELKGGEVEVRQKNTSDSEE